MIRLLRSEGTS